MSYCLACRQTDAPGLFCGTATVNLLTESVSQFLELAELQPNCSLPAKESQFCADPAQSKLTPPASSLWLPTIKSSFCFLPWYNRNGWLGVKHQVTYLFCSSTAESRWESQMICSCKLAFKISDKQEVWTIADWALEVSSADSGPAWASVRQRGQNLPALI